MAVDLFVGAGLGAAVGEILKSILDVADKTVAFKSTFERLESTLYSLKPVIEEIENQNQVLDRRKEIEELTEIIRKGNELVIECSKLNRWCCFKRPKYTRKLLDLDASIARYIGTNMMLLQVRNTNEIIIKMGKGMSLGRTRLGTPCAVPQLPEIVVGLDKPVKELKMLLFKDEVSVLVLTAPGGCGKTTLAKKFCQDAEVRAKFKDNIFFVTVSKKASLQGIVKKLSEHCNQGREFHSNDDAINWLEQLLKQMAQNPILLVLDDVWSGSIIEKFVFRISNYKILVTSRCVFPRFPSTYHLRSLDYEDAMTLFRHSAFLQDASSYVPDEQLVRKIVKRCNGFPLVLTVIGGSLCGQRPAMWHNRVSEWSKGLSIFDSDSDLLDCLGTSLELDALNNKVLIKECFMDLGSFLEDQKIPATVLIDMWAELYELEEDGKGAIANLHELSNRNLANLVVTSHRSDAVCHANEVDGFYNEHFVTQHDVLRDLAIYMSNLEPIEQRKRLIMDISGNNLPNCWMEQKHHPLRARLLSISTDETFSSTWCSVQLPEVEVLVLNFQTKNYTLPEFIEKMDKLKVLVVTRNGFFPAELSNFPLLGSLSSLKRIRLEKISIPPFRDTTIKLENLQKISLVMCNVNHALRDCTISLADMLPNLVEINIDCCNDLAELPAELCDIVHLKKLSITNCHKLSTLPEEIRKLENLEVLRLSSCSGLLDLQDSIKSLQKLRILDISDCVSIRKLPEQIGELRDLEKLYMSGRLKLFELPASIMDLRHLKHVICDEQKASLWKPFQRHFSNMRMEVLTEDFNLNWLG